LKVSKDASLRSSQVSQILLLLRRLQLPSLELKRLYADLVWCYKILFGIVDVTSCAGGRHNMPRPCKLTFDLESGVLVTCDVGYLCANFSLPRPLCYRLRPDVRNRQTSDKLVKRAASLNAPGPRGGGIIIKCFKVGCGFCGCVDV